VLCCDTTQDIDDIGAAKLLTRLDGKTFPGEYIDKAV
jgi:hypothetical protein